MKERRSGPDIIVTLIKVLSVVCGSLLIVALLLIDRAKPGIETFFDRLLDVQLRKSWDHDLLVTHLFVVATICCLSIIGLIFNKLRARRKKDRYRKSLIFSIIFSMVALLFSLVLLPL